MTILLHPNKKNPVRYRVWDKELRVQSYYPLTAKGKAEAELHESRIKSRKHARKLRAELGINKLFASDGSVRGLRRILRHRNGRSSKEFLSLYAVRKQTEIAVNDGTFEITYNKAQAWLLKQHGIEESNEISIMFKKAKHLYWKSLLPDTKNFKT